MTNWTINKNNNVFVKRFRITDVKEVEKISDIDLLLELEQTDTNFKYSYRLISKLYSNGNVPLNVTNLFLACGLLSIPDSKKSELVKELTSKNPNLDVLKEFLVGKEIKLLRYSYDYDTDKNTFKYKFWKGNTDFKDRVNPFDVNTSDERIKEVFYKAVHSGIVKDYMEVAPDNTAVNDEPQSNSEVPF